MKNQGEIYISKCNNILKLQKLLVSIYTPTDNNHKEGLEP